MRKREFSAHLLRESDSEDGIFQASVFPPTKISLASVKLKNRNKSTKEVSLLGKAAMGNQSLERLSTNSKGGSETNLDKLL